MATKKNKTAPAPKKKTAATAKAKPAAPKTTKGSGKAVLGAPPPRTAEAIDAMAGVLKNVATEKKITPTALMSHLYDAVLLTYARGRTISAASREFGISSQAFGAAVRLRAIKNPAFRDLKPVQV